MMAEGFEQWKKAVYNHFTQKYYLRPLLFYQYYLLRENEKLLKFKAVMFLWTSIKILECIEA